jgi:hypothetical protein
LIAEREVEHATAAGFVEVPNGLLNNCLGPVLLRKDHTVLVQGISSQHLRIGDQNLRHPHTGLDALGHIAINNEASNLRSMAMLINDGVLSTVEITLVDDPAT